MSQSKERIGCPVCGYKELTWLDVSGSTTFDICDSCGCEAGYEYDQNTTADRFLALRKSWLIEREGRWHSTTVKSPERWNPEGQLIEAKLEVPERG